MDIDQCQNETETGLLLPKKSLLLPKTTVLLSTVTGKLIGPKAGAGFPRDPHQVGRGSGSRCGGPPVATPPSKAGEGPKPATWWHPVPAGAGSQLPARAGAVSLLRSQIPALAGQSSSSGRLLPVRAGQSPMLPVLSPAGPSPLPGWLPVAPSMALLPTGAGDSRVPGAGIPLTEMRRGTSSGIRRELSPVP